MRISTLPRFSLRVAEEKRLQTKEDAPGRNNRAPCWGTRATGERRLSQRARSPKWPRHSRDHSLRGCPRTRPLSLGSPRGSSTPCARSPAAPRRCTSGPATTRLAALGPPKLWIEWTQPSLCRAGGGQSHPITLSSRFPPSSSSAHVLQGGGNGGKLSDRKIESPGKAWVRATGAEVASRGGERRRREDRTRIPPTPTTTTTTTTRTEITDLHTYVFLGK